MKVAIYNVSERWVYFTMKVSKPIAKFEAKKGMITCAEIVQVM